MYKSANPGPVLDVWSWQANSACRGLDTEMFYAIDFARGAPKRAHEAAAKAICATCPVIEQCLDWALKVGEPYGIWGGLNPEEREATRDRQDPRANPKTDRLEVEVAYRWAHADTQVPTEERECG